MILIVGTSVTLALALNFARASWGKSVGNTLNTPLQKVDYAYNIRGWLTSINNDPTNNLLLNTTEKDLFAFKINYNTVQNETGYTGTALYNGNISETYWRTSSDNVLRKYGYTYDNLNRLKDATYQKPGNTTPVPKSYDENLTYDPNGNIKTLKRNGAIDGALPANALDDLSYTYAANSNKLLNVFDASNNNTAGFVDINKSDDDYTYDANGNTITDKNKGIVSIVYNHLNLPIKISNNYFSLYYIYNALGQKVQKQIANVTTDYLGGFQYRAESTPGPGPTLQFFPTAEGYVKNTSGVLSYVFNYTDHLGNVRVSYEKDAATGSLKIIDENNYYPFGLKHSGYNTITPTPNYKYKFQEQEYQDELGLNWYSFKWRNYDPAIGRFMTVDPLAEETPNWSPYAFCNNNPLFFTDPTGMSAEPPVNGLDYFSDNTGEYFWNKDKNAYAVHTPNGDGTTSFSGNYYTANEFSKPVGDYSIIFDLSNAKPKDEFNKNRTITSVSDPLYSYLNTRSIIDGGGLKNISDPEKFPGVEIYSSPHMNGALTAGNVIFTNPGMEDNGTLAHEYGHYLDYKNHFKYNQSEYLKTIALPSFISATRATFDETRNHEDSKSEQRANILGGAFSGLKLYKR